MIGTLRSLACAEISQQRVIEMEVRRSLYVTCFVLALGVGRGELLVGSACIPVVVSEQVTLARTKRGVDTWLVLSLFTVAMSSAVYLASDVLLGYY